VSRRLRAGAQTLADSGGVRSSTENEKGDIGAEFEGDLHQGAAVERQAPEAIQAQEHGRCVTAAPAQPSAHRDVFVQPDADALPTAAFVGEPAGGPNRQIPFGWHACDRVQQFDHTIVAVSQIDPVFEIDQLKDGLEQMVAVCPSAGHMEEQV
jgi:hypothetical protein